MKNTIKILAVIIVISLTTAVVAIKDSVFAASSGKLTCLVVGFDDAAENTDVLSIVDFDFIADTIKVFQIPRDTYFNFGGFQNKINQIFPSLRATGLSKQRAMRSLCETLKEHLAIDIDGYIGITTQAFKDAIAFFGGIYVDSDRDIELLSDDGDSLLRLLRGENHLSSDQALLLARYRLGYVRGDLDRLDAQKLLIYGFYKTVVRCGGYKMLASMLLFLSGVTTDISLSQVVPLLGRIPDISGMTVTATIIPGEAVADTRGIWYYSLNRRKAIDTLRSCSTFDEEKFDSKRLFFKSDDIKFSNIYNG